MTYKELIPYLQDRHFYPHVSLTQKKDSTEIEWLWLECSPIMSEIKLPKVREVLPEGFRADYISNIQEIHIKKNA